MRHCLLIVLLAAAPLGAQEPAGFRMDLLAGGLDRWHVTGCEVAVEGGVLLLKGGDGFVRSESRYRDFVLELDYRPLQKEKYDAGIYIRCELPPEGRPWPAQHQVNLKHGDELNLIKFPMARKHFRRIRMVIELTETGTAVSRDDFVRVVNSGNPILTAGTGFVALLLIVYLMVLKPF